MTSKKGQGEWGLFHPSYLDHQCGNGSHQANFEQRSQQAAGGDPSATGGRHVFRLLVHNVLGLPGQKIPAEEDPRGGGQG